MSSSKRPVHPTRQQLDELEALLQRMLALPVNQLEGESSSLSLPALTPIDMPPDWESGDAAVLSAESARPPREHGPTDKSERATDETRAAGSGQLSKSLAVTGDADEPERSSDSPRWTEPEETQNVAAAATNLTIVTRPAIGERPWQLPVRARRIPWALRPLVWSNRAFDRCAGRLGASGRWLRGPSGRGLIGWSGIALLASAAAWAWLEWMGWTW
jgi:hypothetical protein